MGEHIKEIIVAIISFFAGVGCTVFVQNIRIKVSNKQRDVNQSIVGDGNTQTGRDTYAR